MSSAEHSKNRELGGDIRIATGEAARYDSGDPHVTRVVAREGKIVEIPEVNSAAMQDVNKGGRNGAERTYSRVILRIV